MGIRLLSDNYSSPPVPPPHHQKNNLWLHRSSNPPLLPRIPVEVFNRIILNVIKSSSLSICSSRTLILRLSSTCSYFRNLFRNDVYSRITISSSSNLTEFVAYLSVCSWPGQNSALKSLTLCWLQKAHHSFYTTPESHHEASGEIILSLKIALEMHTEGLESLTLDFPGAGIAFQTAILKTPGFVSKQHLKYLRITNGLCPLLQPTTYLLCAISSLCARSVEQLIIDMGCEAFYLSDEEFYPLRMKVPGDEMFIIFERLERLEKLEVKGIGGFTDECLAWMVGGCQLLNSLENGNSLILEGCQSLTENGVKRILAGMNKGSRTYTRIRYSNVEPLAKKSKVPTPDTWWALFGYDEDSIVDDDRAFSFISDDDSFTRTARIRSMSDIIHEDPDTFENHFDRTRYGSSKRSQDSYQSTYARQRAYTQHFVQKYAREAHICDSTANGCRNLPRLDIPAYGLPCSPSYGYCSSELGNYCPTALEWMLDEDSSYINHHVTPRAADQTPTSRVAGSLKKLHGDSRISSSTGFPMRSLSDPPPKFKYKKDARKSMNFHSGDFKRLTRLVEEVPLTKGLRFVSLRGLWESRKGWFRCKRA